MSYHFKMEDVEDLVYFFMNAPIDKPFSKSILINVLCKINELPDDDPQVVHDVEAWLTKTKQKLEQRDASHL
jgi:hypothetical protein